MILPLTPLCTPSRLLRSFTVSVRATVQTRSPLLRHALRSASTSPSAVSLNLQLEDDVLATHTATIRPHDTLLSALTSADLGDLGWEGGACGGACSCTTCRVVFASQDLYDELPGPEEDEEDMLASAAAQEADDGDTEAEDAFLERSRLSCQIPLATSAALLDGAEILIPDCTPVNMLEIPLWLRKR